MSRIHTERLFLRNYDLIVLQMNCTDLLPPPFSLTSYICVLLLRDGSGMTPLLSRDLMFSFTGLFAGNKT
jgi:hypothetical protein